MKFNEQRTIFINGDIEPKMAGDIAMQLWKLNVEEPHKYISIVINSSGGSIKAMMTIINAIKASTAKIITINIGKAASCAAILFLQGAIRYMIKGSELYFHEPRYTFKEIPYSKLINELDEIEEEYGFIRDQIYTKCKDKYDLRQVESNLEKGWWMGSEEAERTNMATDIIEKFF